VGEGEGRVALPEDSGFLRDGVHYRGSQAKKGDALMGGKKKKNDEQGPSGANTPQRP